MRRENSPAEPDTSSRATHIHTHSRGARRPKHHSHTICGRFKAKTDTDWRVRAQRAPRARRTTQSALLVHTRAVRALTLCVCVRPRRPGCVQGARVRARALQRQHRHSATVTAHQPGSRRQSRVACVRSAVFGGAVFGWGNARGMVVVVCRSVRAARWGIPRMVWRFVGGVPFRGYALSTRVLESFELSVLVAMQRGK